MCTLWWWRTEIGNTAPVDTQVKLPKEGLLTEMSAMALQCRSSMYTSAVFKGTVVAWFLIRADTHNINYEAKRQSTSKSRLILLPQD